MHNSTSTIIANKATTKQLVKGKQVPDWGTSQSEHIGIVDEQKKVRKRWTADRINSWLIPPQNGNVMFTAFQVDLSNVFADFSPFLCFCKISEDKGKNLFDNSQAVCLSRVALAYLAVPQTCVHWYIVL